MRSIIVNESSPEVDAAVSRDHCATATPAWWQSDTVSQKKKLKIVRETIILWLTKGINLITSNFCVPDSHITVTFYFKVCLRIS